jgi:Ni/Fe-hydrogenase subunit HybB-like protein
MGELLFSGGLVAAGVVAYVLTVRALPVLSGVPSAAERRAPGLKRAA